jgi:hypothetical protein
VALELVTLSDLFAESVEGVVLESTCVFQSL